MDVPAPLSDDTCMEAVEDLVQDSAETPSTCDNCNSSSLVNSANELSETVKSGRSADMIVDVPFVCMPQVGKKVELADQKSVGNPQRTIDNQPCSVRSRVRPVSCTLYANPIKSNKIQSAKIFLHIILQSNPKTGPNKQK